MSRAQEARRRSRAVKRLKQPKVGQQAVLNGKPVIWSGQNYGWQSKSSHNKLKQQGKLRVGTQALDRLTSSATQALSKVTPKVVKDAAKAYGQRLAKSQQQQAATEQAIIDQGGIGAAYFSAKQDANGRRARDVEAVSKRLNIDPRIVNTAITAAETALEGKVGLDELTVFTRNYVKNLDAPTVYAQGAKLNPGDVYRTPGSKGKPETLRAVERRADPNGQIAREARRQARDPVATERAAAAAEASRFKPRQPPDRRTQRAEQRRFDDKNVDEFNERHSSKPKPDDAFKDVNRNRQDVEIVTRGGRKIKGIGTKPELVGGKSKNRAQLSLDTGPTDAQRTAAQMRELRSRMRGIKSRGDVEIEPSFTSDGRRIVYTGGSLNVIQDPDTKRLRGRDTAQPRETTRDQVADLPTTKGKGQQGASGASARSVGNPTRREAIRQFRQTKKGGAILSSNRRKPEVLKEGSKDPSADYLTPRLNRAIDDHTARTISGRNADGSVAYFRTPDGRLVPLQPSASRSPSRSAPSSPITPRLSSREGVYAHGRSRRHNSAPQKATDKREGVKQKDGTTKTQRTARGGRVRALKDQGATRPVRPQQRGTTTNAEGRRFDQQQRDQMQGRKTSDLTRRRAQRRPDPGLRADTRQRVAEFRATTSSPGAARKTSPAPRPVRTNKTNTRIEGAEKRRLPPDQKRSSNPKPLKDAPEVGVASQRRAANQKPKPYNPPKPSPESPAADYQRRLAQARREARKLPPAERRRVLRQLRGESLEAARNDPRVKAALDLVDREQRTRTGQVDQSNAGKTRAANARLRLQGGSARLPEFQGMPLPDEIVQQGSTPMPNIAKPSAADGRWDATTYGDMTRQQFKKSGELKGVKTKGQAKTKSRSKKQSEAAAKSTAPIKQRNAERERLAGTKKAETTKAKTAARLKKLRERRAELRRQRRR